MVSLLVICVGVSFNMYKMPWDVKRLLFFPVVAFFIFTGYIYYYSGYGSWSGVLWMFTLMLIMPLLLKWIEEGD